MAGRRKRLPIEDTPPEPTEADVALARISERTPSIQYAAALEDLTPLQSIFVQEFLLDLNGARAYKRCGGNTKKPSAGARQMLNQPGVSEAIRLGMEERSLRTEVAADMVVLELSRIAFGDVREVVRFTGRHIEIIPIDEMDPNAGRAIAELKEVQSGNTTSVTVKMHDKMRALELLAKHLGMVSDHKTLTGKIEHVHGVLLATAPEEADAWAAKAAEQQSLHVTDAEVVE